MIDIDIFISLNMTEEESKNLSIPKEAIKDFVGSGFSSNTFSGKVIFECKPRAVPPDLIDIVINLKDIGETLIVWGTIFTSIIKFCKKAIGYEKMIHIRKKDKDEELRIDIPVDEDSYKETIDKIEKWTQEK